MQVALIFNNAIIQPAEFTSKGAATYKWGGRHHFKMEKNGRIELTSTGLLSLAHLWVKYGAEGD